MKIRSMIVAAGITVGAPVAVTAQIALPTWSELEASYDKDGGTEAARQSIVTALPRGMDIDAARNALIADQATCKSNRRKPDVERCLIHQYSLLDGAADDVRWSIDLFASQGRLASITVKREVDRHGDA
jgi:hypothetical protein